MIIKEQLERLFEFDADEPFHEHAHCIEASDRFLATDIFEKYGLKRGDFCAGVMYCPATNELMLWHKQNIQTPNGVKEAAPTIINFPL